VFRSALLGEVDPFERVEADDGYVGEHPKYVKCPGGFTNPEITEFMQHRFKYWGILQQVFRHNIAQHGEVFRAIAVITRIVINNGSKLFACGYKDPPYDEREESS